MTRLVHLPWKLPWAYTRISPGLSRDGPGINQVIRLLFFLLDGKFGFWIFLLGFSELGTGLDRRGSPRSVIRSGISLWDALSVDFDAVLVFSNIPTIFQSKM